MISVTRQLKSGTVACNASCYDLVTGHRSATHQTICASVVRAASHICHVLRCVWLLGVIVGSRNLYIAVCFTMRVSAVQV